MKKIICILFIAGFIYAQDQPVVFPFGNAAAVSDSIRLQDGYYLAGIFVNDSLDIDTFYVQVHLLYDTTTAGANVWYNIHYNNVEYFVIGSNTKSLFIPFNPLALEPIDGNLGARANYIRLKLTGQDTAGGDKTPGICTIKGIMRKY